MNKNTDKTKEQLLTELAELRKKSKEQEDKLKASNQQLDAHNQMLRTSEQTLKKQTHQLNERIKELNCLHSFSEVVRTRKTLEQILQGVTEVIPPSWQYPQITCSKITLWDKEYKTENYKDSQWKLSSDIRVNKKIAGKIEVCYLKNKPARYIGPFLKEERVLLDTITERLGRITERKLAEEEIIQQNDFLNNVMESLTHSFYVIDVNDYSILIANSASGFNSGSEKTTCHALTHNSAVPCNTQDHPCPLEIIKKTRQQAMVEHIHFDKAGNERNVEVYSYPVIDKNGDINSMIEYSLDITERKLAEESLKASEKLLSTIAENFPNSYLSVINKDFTIGLTSGQELKKQNIDPKQFEGLKLDQVFGDKTEFILEKYKKTFQGEEQTFEMFYNDQYQLYKTVPLYTEDGSIPQILSVVENITESKEAEQKINDLLQEKEILLHEVHHRIKNNMATIESLLRLHQNNLKNAEAKDALLDAGSRIKSMRILYDKLFRSDNFNDVRSTDYLPTLITEVLSVFPERDKISVEEDIEEFYLKAKLIFPLGILINELITNIMKYAFKDDENNKIKVIVKRKHELVKIVIQDNGVGLPANFDFANSKGFGLHLVRLLADQLKAEVNFESKNGTKISIEFKLK